MKRTHLLLLGVIVSIVGFFGMTTLFETFEECHDSKCPPVNSQVTDFQKFMIEDGVLLDEPIKFEKHPVTGSEQP